jgi:hypothetical protein
MQMMDNHHEVIYKKCYDLVDLVRGGTIHCVKTSHLHTMCFPNHFKMLPCIHVMHDHIITHRMGHHSLIHQI